MTTANYNAWKSSLDTISQTYLSARVPYTAKCLQITEAAKCLWLRKMNGDRRQKYRRALSVAECGGVPNKIREVKVTQVNSKTILGNSTLPPPLSPYPITRITRAWNSPTKPTYIHMYIR